MHEVQSLGFLISREIQFPGKQHLLYKHPRKTKSDIGCAYKVKKAIFDFLEISGRFSPGNGKCKKSEIPGKAGTGNP
jgi:hypothetical protein